MAHAGPSTQLLPTQFPVATFTLLQTLRPALVKAFPVQHDEPARADTTDDDNPEAKAELGNNVKLIRLILGGWLEGLAAEEGKNGAHGTTTTTDALSTLAASLDGPTRYLLQHPSALFLHPEPEGTVNLPSLTNGTSLGAISEGQDDLSTFLFPRILRATASLEAALLSTPKPRPDATDVSSKLWRERQELKEKLEMLLETVVGALARFAVRVDWKGKDLPIQGGIGKAREMMDDMVKLLRALLPSAHNPLPNYPHTLPRLERSKAIHGSTDADPFDPNNSSITLRTPLHTRALLLTTLRVLINCISASPFLSDFTPAISSLIADSWPPPRSVVGSAKGKERAHDTSERILACTLDLVVDLLNAPIASFAAAAMEVLAIRASDILQYRLSSRDPDGMDVDPETEVEECLECIDAALAKIFAKLWREMKEGNDGEGGRGRLRQVLAAVVIENGERMIDCLTGQEPSVLLRLSSLLALSLPLIPRPMPSSAPPPTSSSAAFELLSSNLTHALASFSDQHPSLPFDVPPSLPALGLLANLVWKTHHQSLQSRLQVISSQRKTKKRPLDESQNESMDVGSSLVENGRMRDSSGNLKRVAWRESVQVVWNQFMNKGDLNLDVEGLEKVILRHTENLATLSNDDAIKTLKGIGLLGCARDRTISFAPSSIDAPSPSQPSCSICDQWTGTVAADYEEPSRGAARVFTDVPLQGMRIASSSILDLGTDTALRLAFMKALARLLRHTRTQDAALKMGGQDSMMEGVFKEMMAPTRTLRMAAGNVLVAAVQAHQENDLPPVFIEQVCQRLDVYLEHSKTAVIETALMTLGRIARIATFQGYLESECLKRLVARLGHPNTFLKSMARTQLEQVADKRNVKPFALVRTHFAAIAPILVNPQSSSRSTLSAAVDCFHQPLESILALTSRFTLPSLVLHNQCNMIEQIAEASKQTIPKKLFEEAATILSFLYMRPTEAETSDGLRVFMREMTRDITADKDKVTLANIIEGVRVPLVYNLALELGDEDEVVAAQAETALRNVERARKSAHKTANIDLGVVLKESIVGILSLMNRGLNEPDTHRPLRSKQAILRSLGGVTARVGPAIAGFSPQIMATLQSALEVPGLRGVTLKAYSSFIESLKFNEIGPFIGSTSATFVRLWPEFTPMERQTATATLNYIIVDNAEDFSRFVQDVADLSGITELNTANRRLLAMRKTWSFEKRSTYLLARIESETDVVVLQALKELKTLMVGTVPQLQAFSAGDSFNESVGRLIKVLFSAAVKDGVDNVQIRGTAFECIGILGALDPDRFEVPPGESPTIVLENFTSHDESINFALHLIQHLLIGAYRSTNDTKHQECLAFAIQELLAFCGFTVDLVLATASTAKPVDSTTRERWNQLPKSVLETCGPLLGGSFQMQEKTSPVAAVYPIYSSTHSYREWIRIWAADLISKVEGASVKRIFSAFPPVLRLEDIAVAQHLLPHLVLNALISGSDDDRAHVKTEMETVLQDQVSPTRQLSDNSRLLTAQTVFGLMDHLSRWITLARKSQADARGKKRTSKGAARTVMDDAKFYAITQVEGILQDIPHVLVGQAALTCKAYARSLLNFESHIVAQRSSKNDANLQEYYENLHECYADLDEPDGMEGISTKIVAPSVLHQIREHESTGRWTSAQSCWEVKLQQKPEEPANHLGLLRCLRNLGHYDSMRTHIVGILHSRNEQADWDRILAPFSIEASLIVGDWDAVEEALRIPNIEGPEVAFGKVIGAMREGTSEQLERAFFEARERLGSPIVAAGRESYRRVYDSVIHLHILHELEMIQTARLLAPGGIATSLSKTLTSRLESTSPSFRDREPILNMRRTAFRLMSSSAAREQIGDLWLETSKIARKAGHSQTAYSAILQARDLDAPFAFLQSAKLLMANDEEYKAIQTIDNSLQGLLPTIHKTPHPLASTGPPTPLAKASLRRARWMHQAGRLEGHEIITNYKESTELSKDWESPYYYLGQYYNLQYEKLARKEGFKPAVHGLQDRSETCKLFSLALSHGTKFIYQAMPRMLTIWLELGETAELLKIMKVKKENPATVLSGDSYEIYNAFTAINKLIKKNIEKLPTYQWLTVLPQLVSRILHSNSTLYEVLERILLRVLMAYPHHAFWAMASGSKSEKSATSGKRTKRTRAIFQKGTETSNARGGLIDIGTLIDDGIKLVDSLLHLCNYEITKNDPLSMKKTFPGLYKLAPTMLIIPLQKSLNVSLPSDASLMATHKPFPESLVVFHKFDDVVTIMTSLQKPRKISVWGSDGREYGFLCKPKDDLRKDSRLMAFNSMIIKLLNKDSEARKRRLDIRTYSVVPLNEECGLIEWVPHVVVLRTILNRSYTAKGISAWSPELKVTFDTIREHDALIGDRFDKEVQKKFPPVFHEWFLETFPEPSAWLRARLAYSRTQAVMCMVGFILGLGDRHCENILLDGTTGDTVHVDFNCLFDRGRTFEVGEKVPFRLTNNIVDGMGVTGVEGVYRHAAEITLRILRDNKDSLGSVLETFLHDPLLEWDQVKKKGRDRTMDPALLIEREARKNLEPILLKLRGLQVVSDPSSKGETEVTVGEQVERLIREARSSKNLGSMYVGWCAWF